GAALVFTELVHQAARHERAHRLVDEEHVEEESVERVTDEALRTLAARAGLALLLTAGGALVALLLSAAGPQYFRDGLESASTLGAAVWTLLVFALLALYVLVRGAKFPKLPKRAPKALPTDHLEVVAPDVIE